MWSSMRCKSAYLWTPSLIQGHCGTQSVSCVLGRVCSGLAMRVCRRSSGRGLRVGRHGALHYSAECARLSGWTLTFWRFGVGMELVRGWKLRLDNFSVRIEETHFGFSWLPWIVANQRLKFPSCPVEPYYV